MEPIDQEVLRHIAELIAIRNSPQAQRITDQAIAYMAAMPISFTWNREEHC